MFELSWTMICLRRPQKKKYPSASARITSPESSHPSLNAAFVASGSFQ